MWIIKASRLVARQMLTAHFAANKTICNQTIWHRYCAPAKMANRPHAQIRARTAHEKRQKAVLSIIRSYYIQQASQYKRVTSMSCLYVLLYRLDMTPPLIFRAYTYAVYSQILYDFFCDFFYFHFFISVFSLMYWYYLHFALYFAPHSHECLFVYN